MTSRLLVKIPLQGFVPVMVLKNVYRSQNYRVTDDHLKSMHRKTKKNDAIKECQCGFEREKCGLV